MTFWFRLGSLSAPDFRDRLGSPVRLTTRQTDEKSKHRLTSFMEYPAEFEPIETNSAPAFPFGNSTFKRAWISRLMYQKTFRGQLAVDLLAVARHGRRAITASSRQVEAG